MLARNIDNEDSSEQNAEEAWQEAMQGLRKAYLRRMFRWKQVQWGRSACGHTAKYWMFYEPSAATKFTLVFTISQNTIRFADVKDFDCGYRKPTAEEQEFDHWPQIIEQFCTQHITELREAISFDAIVDEHPEASSVSIEFHKGEKPKINYSIYFIFK